MKTYRIEILIVLLVAMVGGIFAVKSFLNGYAIFNGNLDVNFNSALGSFFSGTVGLVISAYTAILVYKTYHLQSKELDETRKLLFIQSFDQTFFQLLGFLKDTVRNVAYDDAVQPLIGSHEPAQVAQHRGYEVIRFYTRTFSRLIKEISQRTDYPETETRVSYRLYSRVLGLKQADIDVLCEKFKNLSPAKRIQLAYLGCYVAFQHLLSSYCKITYQVLKHIDSLVTTPFTDRRAKYASIFQASLNTDEMLLLFYNAVSYPKAKELLENYGILENLYVEDLIDVSHSKIFTSVNRSRHAHWQRVMDEN